jgi:TonB family protein
VCGGTVRLEAGGRRQRLDEVQKIARQAKSGEPTPVGTVAPRKIKDATPAWPAQAIEPVGRAVVILEIVVHTSGKVSEARVLRSHPPFDQAAIECVHKWEYTPATINGVATPVSFTVAVEFRR